MKPLPLYLGVKAVIIKNNKLLLLKKHDGPTSWFWDKPGGRVNPGEALEETLDRELREELPSLNKYTVRRLLAAYKKEEPIKDGSEICFLYYQIDTAPFEIELSSEHTEFKWMSLEEIEQLPPPQSTVNSYLLKAGLEPFQFEENVYSPFIKSKP